MKKSHIRMPATGRPMLAILMILAIASVAGCAAHNAYREGQKLLSVGDLRGAYQAHEEAHRLSPDTVEYRLASTRTRERLLNALIGQARLTMSAGKIDEAEGFLREALAIDGGNERALAELAAIDARRQQDLAVQRAVAARAAGDDPTARQSLQGVLLENPSHGTARSLLGELNATIPDTKRISLPKAVLARPITLEFKDAPIKTVFEIVSRTSGLNFVFDKDVKTDQKTSIFLKDSTIELAVSLVLLTNQLEMRTLDERTVLVYPNNPAKLKDYQPLSVRAFYLANAEAKSIEGTLKAIAKPRELVVDEKLNMLIVRDSEDALSVIEKIIALQDIPEPEVMLEVEILEVKRSRLQDLGVRWPDQLSLTPLPAGSGSTVTLQDLRDISASTTAAAISPGVVKAQNQNTNANILANPRIRARNREKAKILIGERVPNVTTTSSSTGFVSESVSYVDVGLKLEVEPTIYLENEVAIKLSLEVSNLISQIETKSGSLAYQIGTRTATSVLRLRDGENQVIAGLINDEDRRTSNQVPLLGKVPILGRLFGSQVDDAAKTEIVLSITPRIVRNVQRRSVAAAQFSAGTESSLTNRVVMTPTMPAKTSAGETRDGPGPAATARGTPAGPPAAPTASLDGEASLRGDPVSTEAPTGHAQLQWQGPTEVAVGDTFALQLFVQSDIPIIGLPLAVGFDPEVLEVVSVTEGDFLGQGGAQSSFNTRVDTAGRVLITANRAGEGGATTSGAAFSLRMRARTSTDLSRVQLLTAVPVGIGGRNISAPLPLPHGIKVVP